MPKFFVTWEMVYFKNGLAIVEAENCILAKGLVYRDIAMYAEKEEFGSHIEDCVIDCIEVDPITGLSKVKL